MDQNFLPTRGSAHYSFVSSPPSDEIFGNRGTHPHLPDSGFSVTHTSTMDSKVDTNTTSYLHSIHKPNHTMHQTPPSTMPWNGVQKPFTYSGPLYSTHTQTFGRVPNEAVYSQYQAGGFFDERHASDRFNDDCKQLNPFMTLTRPTEGISQEVNKYVKTTTSSTTYSQPFVGRYRTQQPYFLDSVGNASESRLLSSHYRPAPPGIPDLFNSDPSHIYSEFDLHDATPALSRSLSQSTKTDNAAIFTPQSLHTPFGTPNNVESDHDTVSPSEPYAQLIFRALKSVPGYRMVLKEIYEWFEKNTNKARNNNAKGWQNSIRHNLSMNHVGLRTLTDDQISQHGVPRAVLIDWQAFMKVEQSRPKGDAKKGYIWVLREEALQHGVESTTRYRKNASSKKRGRRQPSTEQHQRSGAVGACSARTVARRRRSHRSRSAPKSRDTMVIQEGLSGSPPLAMPYKLSESSMSTGIYHDQHSPYCLPSCDPLDPHPTTGESPYGFEDIMGCTESLDSDDLFYSAFDDDTMLPLSDPDFRESEHTLMDLETLSKLFVRSFYSITNKSGRMIIQQVSFKHSSPRAPRCHVFALTMK